MAKIELDIHKIEKLEVKEKIDYLYRLRERCEEIQSNPTLINGAARSFVRSIYPPIVRRYEYELVGEENIPRDKKAIFMCNHSNSHDFFTSLEGLKKTGIESTVFVASDDLNKATQMIFGACNATLADRTDKDSTKEGLIRFCSKMIGDKGVYGVMHGEATWNMHPFRLMQDLKLGGIVASLIAGVPIVPTIYEYVEVDKIVSKESELYKKCVICFGRTFYPTPNRSLIDQIGELKRIMESMRAQLKCKLGTLKVSLRDVNPLVYVNHTVLKKYYGFGFEYDSASEAKFLYSRNGITVDNEYCLNDDGIFGNLVPGITSKKEGMRFLPKGKH